MKKTFIGRSVLLLPVFLGLALTAKANIVNLVINEVSATTLTYSWQGGALQTVTDTSPDHWTFSIADAVVSATPGQNPYQIYVQWQEPDYANSGLVNWVEFYQYGPAANGTTITVISDNPLDPQHTYPTVGNGQTYTFPNPPAPNGNSVVFNDNGDSVSVPDGGMTASLLGLGLIAVSAFRRKVS